MSKSSQLKKLKQLRKKKNHSMDKSVTISSMKFLEKFKSKKPWIKYLQFN